MTLPSFGLKNEYKEAQKAGPARRLHWQIQIQWSGFITSRK